MTKSSCGHIGISDYASNLCTECFKAALRRAAEKIYNDENLQGSLPPEEWQEYKTSRIGSIERHVRQELEL